MVKMDINYIRENEIHEKYILDQLGEKEKKAYEEFLQSSPEAQRELEQSKKLITGIRTAGSNSMRKEIEEQTTAIRNPKTDWSVMYKAAAVLFIFVLLPAIFYYQHEFADQHEITEQSVGEEYLQPPMTESEETPAAEEYLNAEDERHVYKDVPVEQAAKKEKRTLSGQKEDAPKILQPAVAKKAASGKSAITSQEERISAQMDNTKGAGSSSGISALDDIADNDLQGEMVVVETEKLDEVLSRTAASGAANRSKSDLPETAKVAAPSRSIGLDYIPPIRSFIFVNNNDSLLLNMNSTSTSLAYPDFLKINIKKERPGQINLNIFVSDQLHSSESADINVKWEKNDLITIDFSDKARYKIKLEETQKTAKRID